MTRARSLPVILLGSLVFCIGSIGHGQILPDRSVNQGARPVMVAFANQTPDMVTALWIDYNGMSQEVGTILPGQIVELATFPGHLTVFSSRGRQLSSFRASVSSNGAAYGITGPGGAVDPSKPKIAVCWAPPPGMTGPSGGIPSGPGVSSSPANGVTMNDINGLIRTILSGDPSDSSVRISSTPPTSRKYTGVYRGKQSTFNLTWERPDGSGNVNGMMIIEGDMASSFSGGESSPGLLEVEVSADLNPINHKLRKVVQGGKISWVGDYITLIETK